MPNMNVAVLGTPGYAKEIGKKSTSSDITLYDLKKGSDSVSIMEPSRYPDKVSSLFYCVANARFAILVVDKVDNILGETVLMLDCMGVDQGWLVLRNFLQPEQIKPLLAGTSVESFQFREDDANAMREELLSMAATMPIQEPAKEAVSCGSVPIDHHFNVKGVGTVILGSVMDGFIRKHDKMRVLPLQETVTLRSIQKHDDDWSTAVEGDRVGLALKGIEADRLDRGYVLTTDSSLKTSLEMETDAELVRFWPSALKEGMVMHLGHWMQMVPCRVMKVQGENWRKPRLSLVLDTEMVHRPGDRAVMTYLEGGKLRIVGTLLLP